MASSSQEVASGSQRRLDSKQLPSICSLGKGLSGFVYETEWEGNKYARKDFPLGSQQGNHDFENEAKSLFNLDHPNIVRCFGYTIGDSSCSLVQEYVDDDLRSTIQRRIKAQRNKNSIGSSSNLCLRVVDVDEIKTLFSRIRKTTEVDESSSKIPGSSTLPFNVPEAVHIISQIAAGMEYLHDHQVVHGDLKPKNVLLRSESGAINVKVADFGLVETKKRIKLVSKRTEHFEILMWKAPELFEKLLGPLTEDSDDPFTDSDTDEDLRLESHVHDDFSTMAMADVYSFGLTCSLILGGKLLYPDLSLTQVRKQRMHGFLPELLSAACPDYLRDLVYSCLESKPFCRPTFSSICTKLKALQPQPLSPMTEPGNAGPMDDLDSCKKQDLSGNLRLYEELRLHLKLAEDCMDAVQKTSSRNFNNEQCEYLAGKLHVVVQCTRSLFETSQAQHDERVESVDVAKLVGISKLVVASAEQIESFVQDCCKDAWIQAAMTRTNVSEYVSSLGFNLELCRIAFSEEFVETESLTFDQVDNIYCDEAAMVRMKASADAWNLLARLTLQLSSLKGGERDLATYVLQRLLRMEANPTTFQSGLTLEWGDNDMESFWNSMFKWVKPAEQLVKATASTVHRASWLGIVVAQKTFHGPNNPDFLQEVGILGKLCHPNIMSMFCCANTKPSCDVIMELMDGDLHDLIQKRCRNENACPFPVFEAVEIMLQIGEGMCYLHNQGIVHMDLKPSNILTKSVKTMIAEIEYVHVRVADFGLIKTKESSIGYSIQTVNMSSIRWMAPENITSLKVDGQGMNSLAKHRFEGDVFSFAMVCYEILTGDKPFHKEPFWIVKEKILKGERPNLPSHCPLLLKTFIEDCWVQEPGMRPSFAFICSKLKYLKYLFMKDMSTISSNYTAGIISTSTVDTYTAGSPSSSTVDSFDKSQLMDALSDEVLKQGVFAKLPLIDLLRAQAVCKRWQKIVAQSLDTFDSQDMTTSYCPLFFTRTYLQHFWCGYDCATDGWELLPSLRNLPLADIRPLAGNAKSLLGFKITTVPSQVVVGNPFTNEWQTIPRSTETWGEVGNFLVVDRKDQGSASFRIIAVREDATEIFHSKVEAWRKLRQRPPPGFQEVTVLSMRDKSISGTLCGNLLFYYGGDALVSFDVVAERWTEDHIYLPPHASPKCFQMLDCGGNLFAVIEDVAESTISIWGLGLRRREFFRMAEMPLRWYSVLCRKKWGSKQAQTQLKAVGHKHRMYFWRHFSHDIVVFHHLRRSWAELPSFDRCIRNVTVSFDPADVFQTFVDTGSFEP
ncbi:hypothetical protein M758_11G061900 [Ceratodon purpureus]|nr:hypothetical protein M758_11G061900 [Ceratodon purpureus]